LRDNWVSDFRGKVIARLFWISAKAHYPDPGSLMSLGTKRLVYRPEIDGLRAIAVGAVVLYHLGFSSFSGGYVGVDVFFVISGFLITSIINNEMQRGVFSLAAFYERRVRRIIPALYLVIISSLLLSVCFFLPTDTVALSNTIVATVTFLSNIYFWRTSGYFDTTSEYNAFIHTWSLAVEEQFYIVFPILLLFINGHFPRQKLTVIAGLAGVSLFACVWIAADRREAAFYLAPLRAWELMAGSMLALAPVLRPNSLKWMDLGGLTGIGLLSFAIFYYDKNTLFPSWSALSPVIGTALLLYCAQDGLIGHILRAPPIVWVGLISYSLYLWHWPILVFWKYYSNFALPNSARWELLAVSLLLATVSYHLVEVPFRRRAYCMTRAKILVATATASLGILVTSAVFVLSDGFPARFSSEIAVLDKERSSDLPFSSCLDDSALSARYKSGKFCNLGAQDRPAKTLLWGDSHLSAWGPAFDAAFLRHAESAAFAGASACPPLTSYTKVRSMCAEHNTAVIEYLKSHSEINTVLLVASWSMYANSVDEKSQASGGIDALPFSEAFRSTLAALRGLGKHIVIIGPTPGAPPGGPFAMALARAHEIAFPDPKPLARYLDENATVFALSREAVEHGAAEFVDVGPWFCGAEYCQYESKGLPLYRDGGHLNVRGALSKVDDLDAALTSAGLWQH
jgi:peptidoglycan/LPS O-acetylase OafA/YrhL